MAIHDVQTLVQRYAEEGLQVASYVPGHAHETVIAVVVPAPRATWALYRWDGDWLAEQVDLVSGSPKSLPATTVFAAAHREEDPIEALRTAARLPGYPAGSGDLPTRRPNWTISST